MPSLPRRTERSFLIGCALSVAALIGWSSFAYSAWSSRHLANQVSALATERSEALANHQRLQQTAGDLKQVEAKLGAARLEYSRAVEGWAETRAKLVTGRQELALLTKRIDQARDRVSQTGSVRQPEALKGPARRP